jgi:hypothetical protein
MSDATVKFDPWAQQAWRRDGKCAVRHGDGYTVATAWPHPKVDGPMAESARLIALSTVIPDLYNSEINVKIEWFWDGSFHVALGDDMNGWDAESHFDQWVDALEWLQTKAIEIYPESSFAKARAEGAVQ